MKTTLNNLAGAGLPALGVKRPWLVAVMNLLVAIAGLVAVFAIEVRELPDVDEPGQRAGNFPVLRPRHGRRSHPHSEGAVARVSGVKKSIPTARKAIPEYARCLTRAPTSTELLPMYARRSAVSSANSRTMSSS